MILRLDARASQIEKIRIIRLIIEMKEPIDEIIFHERNVSG